MKIYLVFIISVLFFSCKNREQSVVTSAINDQKLLDNIKKEYDDHYEELGGSWASPSFLGINDFCYDQTRIKIHKTLFQNTTDERFTNFSHGKAIEKVTDSTINTFSIKERLVYALVYPEEYLQTCALYSQLNEDINKQILPYLPRGSEGYYASDRQIKALKKNRDSVATYIKNCFKNKENIPFELFHYIIQLDLYKTIPFLIEHNNQRENSFILALFTTLMLKDEYEPFLNSELFEKMKKKKFSNTKTFNRGEFKAIEKTPERVVELLSYTKNYYAWKLQE